MPCAEGAPATRQTSLYNHQEREGHEEMGKPICFFVFFVRFVVK